MKKLINLFKGLSEIDLKIMKIGLKMCLFISIVSAIILVYFLFCSHTIFSFQLGIALLKLSTYFAVEFIVCGVVADTLNKQLN